MNFHNIPVTFILSTSHILFTMVTSQNIILFYCYYYDYPLKFKLAHVCLNDVSSNISTIDLCFQLHFLPSRQHMRLVFLRLKSKETRSRIDQVGTMWSNRIIILLHSYMHRLLGPANHGTAYGHSLIDQIPHYRCSIKVNKAHLPVYLQECAALSLIILFYIGA